MKFTVHAIRQMRRRGIARCRVEIALLRGREFWRRGALLVMHQRLRVVYCPYTDYVITAWWRGKK